MKKKISTYWICQLGGWGTNIAISSFYYLTLSVRKIDHLFFKDQGVEAHKYYYPLKKQKNSLALYNKIVNLPLHAGLTDYEVEYILSAIKKSIK